MHQTDQPQGLALRARCQTGRLLGQRQLHLKKRQSQRGLLRGLAPWVQRQTGRLKELMLQLKQRSQTIRLQAVPVAWAQCQTVLHACSAEHAYVQPCVHAVLSTPVYSLACLQCQALVSTVLHACTQVHARCNYASAGPDASAQAGEDGTMSLQGLARTWTHICRHAYTHHACSTPGLAWAPKGRACAAELDATAEDAAEAAADAGAVDAGAGAVADELSVLPAGASVAVAEDDAPGGALPKDKPETLKGPEV